MKLEARDDGKYELNIFINGCIYVLTRAELDKLHELIEAVNVKEAKECEQLPPFTKKQMRTYIENL